MNLIPVVHPDEETLVSFGLGKTNEKNTVAIAEHLEQCAVCRSRVAGLPSDSFIDRLKAVRISSGSSISNNTLSTFGSNGPAPSVPIPVPDELVNCAQYEAIRELGKGGMGTVYLAKNKLLGRDEVLKVVNKSMLDRPGAVDRFLREIQSAARLQHPNVVAAYAAMQLGELLVFAMEYVPGLDLAQVARNANRPVPVPNVCYYVLQAAQGLQHAHEKGMVHRDIKPSNLILSKDGTKSLVKILDFGLAKLTSENKIDTSLTSEGRMLGTPDFMAPEQAMDASKADIRADIYSLGCTLFFLLAGRPPFAADSVLKLLQHHQSTAAPSLNRLRPDVPEELAAAVARMMAKEPRMRYQTPAEVIKALTPFLKRGTPTAPVQASPGSEKIETAALVPSQPLDRAKKSHPSATPILFPTLPVDFGRYRVLRLLGQGGMGAVYLAHDSQLDRQVALKIPFFNAAESPQRVERFIREAKSAAILHHPNICTVFDAGQIDGKPFITMAYLAGTPLDHRLNSDQLLSQHQAAGIAWNIAAGLAHAHGKGTVHRDLKPANVMIDTDGKPVVMDFGLAKRSTHQEANEGKLTRRGSVLGTPSYMSPEQVRGETETIGPATDIYSLGVILFEMLTSETPYSGSMVEVMGQILAAPVPPVQELQPDVDPRLDAICRKAMAKEPKSRFPSMTELQAALDQYLNKPPLRTRPEPTVNVELEVVAEAPKPVVEESPFDQLLAPRARQSVPDEQREQKKTEPKETKVWRKNLVVIAGALVLASVCLLAVIVFKVKTSEGILVIEVNEPNAEVYVDDNLVTVSWDNGGKRAEIHIKPGTRNVEVKKDGFTVFGEVVTLEDGKRRILEARLDKLPPLAGSGSDTKTKTKPTDRLTPGQPSPALEALRRDQIPPEALTIAGGGDPSNAPTSLVGVLGEAIPIHTASVLGLAYSPDGHWLATGSVDKTIMLREAQTEGVKRILEGHTGAITSLTFSKDSQVLISSSLDGSIKFWHLDKGDEPVTLRPEIGEIWSMAASPDRRFLAVGGANQPIKFWKWGQWEKPQDLSAITGRRVTSLAFSPDGEQLAASWDGSVRFYRTADGSEIKTWPSEDSNRVLAFHRDGKWLATAGGFVKLWDIESGKELGKVGGAGAFNTMALHPLGKIIYCSEIEGLGGWLMEVPSMKRATDKVGKELMHFREPQGLCSATFSPDGKYLAFGTNDGGVHVWDLAKGQKQLPPRGHAHFIKTLSVGPTGQSILTGGDESAVRRWDVGRPRESKLMDKTHMTLNHVAYSPDGKKYITSASFWDHKSDMGIVWDSATGNRLFNVDPEAKTFRPIFSPDGNLIAGFNDATGCIHLWDARTGKQVYKFSKIGWCADSPAFTADSKRIIAASKDTKTVKVWDVGSGEEIFSWLDAEMTATAVTRDGRLLATGGVDGTISVWDLTVSGLKIKSLSGHSTWITRLKFTPDGKTLVSSSNDGTIRLWSPEVARAREIIPLGPTNRPLIFDLDPSGKYLFAVGQTPVIFILRLQETVDSSEPFRSGGAIQPSKTLDPDRTAAEYVLSIGGVVRVNDEERDRNAAAELPGEAFRLTYVHFHHNGKVSDEGLAHFKGCKNLSFLDLKSTKATDAGLAYFKDCKNLKTFICEHTAVSDLSPLKDMKLTFLQANDTPLKDLSPLEGMNLNHIDCSRTQVSNLSPLKGMKLTYLEFGGTGVTDLTPLKDMNLTHLGFPFTGVADLTPLKNMKLTWMTCYNTQVSNLSALKNSELTFLDCSYTPISDLSPLKGMPLTGLMIKGTQVSDLLSLKDMKLAKLICLDSPVTDAGLASLQKMSGLRQLEIASPKMTDAGLAHLSTLTDLEVLILSNSKLTGSGLAHLQGMARLAILDLNNTDLTDEGLVHLKDLFSLRTLRLGQTRVTDAGLVQLAGLKNLAQIDLKGVAVSDEGIAKLKAALPKCNIIR